MISSFVLIMENGVTAQSVSFMTQYSRRYICSIIDSVVYDYDLKSFEFYIWHYVALFEFVVD